MILKSPYPEVLPAPELNAHYAHFYRPDQAEWPEDYTLHVDARTGKRRTFRQFLERVKLGGTALGSPVSEGGLGIHDGEMVGILSQNSSDYIVLVHSLLMMTTPFALLSAYSTPFELEHSLRLAKPTRLFVHARLLPIVLPVAEKVGIPSERIHVLGGRAKGRKSFKEMIDDARSRDMSILSPRPAKADTLAYLVFSSGTSGLPKAVMISHGNLIWSLSQAAVLAKVNLEVFTPPKLSTPEGIPVHLAFLPMYHSYGLNMFCFRAFLAPVTFIVLDQWDLAVALRSFSKYTVTGAYLIPSVVHQIVNHRGRKDFSSLIAVGCGAAYLPPDLAAKFKALLPKETIFTEGFGMSEATVSAISQPLPGTLNGKLQRQLGSTGVLTPGMEARLLRDDGSEAGLNEVGELYLRGGNVALGYWGNEKATKETFIDGWLRTGDKFRVDEEGHFFFADRAKDTLKVSGIQVSPSEIEDVLLAEPKRLIIDVCVAGVPGGRTSDEKVPRAWVVLSERGEKAGVAATLKLLDKWHQDNLSKYKWLRGGIEVVKEIPKSPTGKVLRRVLQDQHVKNAAAAAKVVAKL